MLLDGDAAVPANIRSVTSPAFPPPLSLSDCERFGEWG